MRTLLALVVLTTATAASAAPNYKQFFGKYAVVQEGCSILALDDKERAYVSMDKNGKAILIKAYSSDSSWMEVRVGSGTIATPGASIETSATTSWTSSVVGNKLTSSSETTWARGSYVETTTLKIVGKTLTVTEYSTGTGEPNFTSCKLVRVQ